MTRYAYSGQRSQSVTISADLAGLDALIDGMSAQAEHAARPAAQAGAQVLYDEVLRNVDRIGKVSGNLRASIYQAYSRDHSINGAASYHVSWRTGRNTIIGANGQKQKSKVPAAPHGHLIEFGWVQRYVSFVDKKGEWKTAIRPEAKGKPKPKSRASKAEKDAYWLLRSAPLVHAPMPFIRPAQSKFPQAAQAMHDRYVAELVAVGVLS